MCHGRGVFGPRSFERIAAFYSGSSSSASCSPCGFDRTRPAERARSWCRPRGVVRDSGWRFTNGGRKLSRGVNRLMSSFANCQSSAVLLLRCDLSKKRLEFPSSGFMPRGVPDKLPRYVPLVFLLNSFWLGRTLTEDYRRRGVREFSSPPHSRAGERKWDP